MDRNSPEGFNEGEILFSEKTIRLGFIRKVYSILMVQIAITTAFIALCVFEVNTKKFIQQNQELYIIALVLTFVLLIALACCPDVRRNFPTNMIALGAFTICESFMLGTISSYYNAEAVVAAAGFTAVVCLGLTLFAFQTKWDFTGLGATLFLAVILLFCFGLFAIIFPSKVMIILYASIGALIFCVYLVFDTQLMMGGKHKYSISPEEYIFGALNLYLDIINIFLLLLTIIGAARN